MSLRELVQRRFPVEVPSNDADDDLATALEALLRTVDDLGVTLDGWSFFRVTGESDTSLEGLGLMDLLPDGAVPIAVEVRREPAGFAWSVRVGRQDRAWLALSESRRWDAVYLHLTGQRGAPAWVWGPRREGQVRTEE